MGRLTINADVLAVDSDGVLLKPSAPTAPQSPRPISVITPPLPAGGPLGLAVEIEAVLPEASPQGLDLDALILWQLQDAERYFYHPWRVRLGSTRTTLQLDLPDEAMGASRLGVQFPGLAGPLRLASLAVVEAPRAARLSLAAGQLIAQEPIAGHSLNYIRGPTVLGNGFNYWLASAAAVVIGIILLQGGLRRRRVSRWTMMSVVFLAIVGADVRATQNLLRQTRDDLAQYRGMAERDQTRIAYGDAVAWVNETLRRDAPHGSTFAVLSDAGTTPAHRLGYLLAPYRTRREDYAAVNFIVVISASSADFDEAGGTFHAGAGRVVGAHMAARLSPDVYILRNSGTHATGAAR